jgi:hypothetical protein
MIVGLDMVNHLKLVIVEGLKRTEIFADNWEQLERMLPEGIKEKKETKTSRKVVDNGSN